MDFPSVLRVVLALAAVAGGMLALAYAMRRAGLVERLKGGAGGRLQIVDSLALDARRRAVLIACDGVEHLVILGPTGETVVAAAPTVDGAAPALRAVNTNAAA
ncbi:MAG: flagellar biosynthetic protein FliO [Pseudomonadota bacterium]